MGDPTLASLRKLFQGVFCIHVPDFPATLRFYVFIELLMYTVAASFCKSTKIGQIQGFKSSEKLYNKNVQLLIFFMCIFTFIDY